MPYSGPASSYAPIGKIEVAYIDMINSQGGINGRKIKLLSLDDGYSPPKTVEQTRKVVEEDGVACIFQQLGTPCATATRKYLNAKKVPQIFVASGATQFGDPEHYPWTIGWQVSYQIEGRVYARYILDSKPNARIAVLYQNDDSGRDFLKGFKDGLGDKGSQLVATNSYEPQAVRQRPVAREHHASGCQSGYPAANVPGGDTLQDHSDRLSRDQAPAPATVRRQGVGAVRGSDCGVACGCISR